MPSLTVEQRSALYSRPFRVIVVDTVGPIKPAVGPQKLKYIFHASCPFTNYAWFRAAPDNTPESAARFLVEDVFFDLAGFPAVLRSDGGGEYLNETVKEVTDLLGIEHAFGAAWHPHSQGHIEGGHNRLNGILAAYTDANPMTWPLWVKFAQWVVRATPRPEKGGYSPYELVTGMKPQGPLHHLFARPRNARGKRCDHCAGLARQAPRCQAACIVIGSRRARSAGLRADRGAKRP